MEVLILTIIPFFACIPFASSNGPNGFLVQFLPPALEQATRDHVHHNFVPGHEKMSTMFVEGFHTVEAGKPVTAGEVIKRLQANEASHLVQEMKKALGIEVHEEYELFDDAPTIPDRDTIPDQDQLIAHVDKREIAPVMEGGLTYGAPAKRVVKKKQEEGPASARDVLQSKAGIKGDQHTEADRAVLIYIGENARFFITGLKVDDETSAGGVLHLVHLGAVKKVENETEQDKEKRLKELHAKGMLAHLNAIEKHLGSGNSHKNSKLHLYDPKTGTVGKALGKLEKLKPHLRKSPQSLAIGPLIYEPTFFVILANPDAGKNHNPLGKNIQPKTEGNAKGAPADVAKGAETNQNGNGAHQRRNSRVHENGPN